MAIYGIDLENDDTIDCLRFCRMAYRLPLYQGAVGARAASLQEENKAPNKTGTPHKGPDAIETSTLTSERGLTNTPLFEMN